MTIFEDKIVEAANKNILHSRRRVIDPLLVKFLPLSCRRDDDIHRSEINQ